MTPAAQQKLTRACSARLVTPERTRAIVELADADQLDRSRDEISRVIDLLVAARLLVVQTRSDAGGGSVEIVHESLIIAGPLCGAGSTRARRTRSSSPSSAPRPSSGTAKGRPAGLLWRGDAMEEAKRWAATSARELAPRDQAFLDAVLSFARRGRRTRRIALIAAFAVLGAVAGGAIVAYVRVRAAEHEVSEKAAEATRAKAKVEAALAEVQEQQRQRDNAEKLRDEAEKQKASTDRQLQATGQQLQLSAEELAAKNAQLEVEKATATQAKEVAEAASRKALAAATEAQKAKAELQVKLDAEKLRVKALEEETRKLSTKLKD